MSKKIKKNSAEKPRVLSECVTESLDHYFTQMGDHMPTDLHKMVLKQVERPLLEKVLQVTDGNQLRAAEILGINRATLRKKIALYNLAAASK